MNIFALSRIGSSTKIKKGKCTKIGSEAKEIEGLWAAREVRDSHGAEGPCCLLQFPASSDVAASRGREGGSGKENPSRTPEEERKTNLLEAADALCSWQRTTARPRKKGHRRGTWNQSFPFGPHISSARRDEEASSHGNQVPWRIRRWPLAPVCVSKKRATR